MRDKPTKSICPLCQQQNKCAVEQGSDCWCMNTNIPKPLLEQIPAEIKGQTCICLACVKKFEQEHGISQA